LRLKQNSSEEENQQTFNHQTDNYLFKHTIQIHFRKNIDQKHIQIDSKYQPLGERLSDGQTDRPLH